MKGSHKILNFTLEHSLSLDDLPLHCFTGFWHIARKNTQSPSESTGTVDSASVYHHNGLEKKM